MHGRIGKATEDDGCRERTGQLEVARDEDRVDQHHGRQDRSDHEDTKRQWRTQQDLAAAQVEEAGKCGQFDQTFEHSDHDDDKKIVRFIDRSQV